MTGCTIRPALPSDLPAIKQILESEGLPYLGVPEHIATFFVAEQQNIIIGSIGLEVYGETALLRSAVVVRPEQKKGIGKAMYSTIIEFAKSKQITRLVLLTTTAEIYFRKKGFASIPQSSVQGAITSSAEFSGACPSHAVCMEKIL